MNDVSAQDPAPTGVSKTADSIREHLMNSISRRDDARRSVDESRIHIAELEHQLHVARSSLAYHERRYDIHERKVAAARDFMRALEDEAMGLY